MISSHFIYFTWFLSVRWHSRMLLLVLSSDSNKLSVFLSARTELKTYTVSVSDLQIGFLLIPDATSGSRNNASFRILKRYTSKRVPLRQGTPQSQYASRWSRHAYTITTEHRLGNETVDIVFDVLHICNSFDVVQHAVAYHHHIWTS